MSPAPPDRKKRREGGRRICHCHRLLLLLLLLLFLFSFVLLGKEGLGCGRTEGAIYILMAFRCDGPRTRKRGLRKMEEATTIRVPKKVISLDQKTCMGHVFGRKRATRETKKPSNRQKHYATAFKFVHTCKYSARSQRRKVATFLLGFKTTKVVCVEVGT